MRMRDLFVPYVVFELKSNERLSDLSKLNLSQNKEIFDKASQFVLSKLFHLHEILCLFQKCMAGHQPQLVRRGLYAC